MKQKKDSRGEKIVLKTLKKLLSLLSEKEAKAKVSAGKEGEILVKLETADPSFLVGFQGRGLAALELILKLMVSSQLDEWRPVLLEINDYRKKQEDQVINLAKKAAVEVEASKRPVYLPPMSSWERRIIHLQLADHPLVSTASEGEGESRRVVVKLK
ncbi:MAG: R3H domain-containing nucleic acid-binding protein [Candidatus Shapirobacteria bacterium]